MREPITINDVLEQWHSRNESLARRIISPQLIHEHFVVGEVDGNWEIYHAPSARTLAPAGELRAARTSGDVLSLAVEFAALQTHGATVDWSNRDLANSLYGPGVQQALADAAIAAKLRVRLSAAEPTTWKKFQNAQPFRNLYELISAWAQPDDHFFALSPEVEGAPGRREVAIAELRRLAATAELILSRSGALVVVGERNNWRICTAYGRTLGGGIGSMKNKTQAKQFAEVLTADLVDHAGSRFPWGSPDVAKHVASFRSADNESFDEAVLRLRAEFDRSKRNDRTFIERYEALRFHPLRPVLDDGNSYVDDLAPGQLIRLEGLVAKISSLEDLGGGRFALTLDDGRSAIPLRRNDVISVLQGPGVIREAEGERRSSVSIEPGDAVAFKAPGDYIDPYGERGFYVLDEVSVRGVVDASHRRGQILTKMVDVTVVNGQGNVIAEHIDLIGAGVHLPMHVLLLDGEHRPDLRAVDATFGDLRRGDLWVEDSAQYTVLQSDHLPRGERRCQVINERTGEIITDHQHPVDMAVRRVAAADRTQQQRERVDLMVEAHINGRAPDIAKAEEVNASDASITSPGVMPTSTFAIGAHNNFRLF